MNRTKKAFEVCLIVVLLSLPSCLGYVGENESSRVDDSFPKYGIRWSVQNNYDLGERCFSSVGLQASIGIGPDDGSSDFDSIYPWSDIRRCNLKRNESGVVAVTYEGEDGFQLDGSNGDVFVRIPKFTISRYVENGYEYRVVGDEAAPFHEAFVENDTVLDEIFIGAFEGCLEKNILFSKSDVIPSSNVTAQSFLDSAKAKGEQYSLYDIRSVDAIWTLMSIEYGKRNTNRIIGYGLADLYQPIKENAVLESSEETNTIKVAYSNEKMEQMPVGSTITICGGSQGNIIAQRTITNAYSTSNELTITFDGQPISIGQEYFIGSGACKTNFCETVSNGALKWHTGRASWNSAGETRNPVRYRWIENPVGNLWHFLPDVTFVDGQMYYCKEMSKYEFGEHDGINYVPVGEPFIENNDNGLKGDYRNKNYWITGLANETSAKAVSFGRNYDKSLNSKEAFGAYYYLDTHNTCFIANGGGFDHLWRCNMLTNRAWITKTTYWYLYGARLLFKNI